MCLVIVLPIQIRQSLNNGLTPTRSRVLRSQGSFCLFISKIEYNHLVNKQCVRMNKARE